MKDYFWFLKKYIKPYWFKISLVIIFGIIVALSKTVVIGLVKIIPDEIFLAKDKAVLYEIPSILILIFAVSGLSRFAHFSLMRGMGEYFAKLIREDLYNTIISQNVDFFTKNHSGSLYSRIINDTNKIPQGILLSIDILRETLTFILYFSWALFFNYKLTLILTFSAPIVIFILNKVGKTIKRYTTKNLEQYSCIGSFLNESFSGIRIIKAFTIENLMQLKFTKFNNELFKVLFKSIRVQELSSPVVEFLFSIVASIVIIIGGTWVIEGTLTPGEFLGIFVALGLCQDPLKKLNIANISFQTSIAALKTIKNILILEPEKTDIGISFNTFNTIIEFKNVNFSYDEKDEFRLDNINLSIKKGEIIALVGESGSGKTTIANLLLRFFYLESGEILIDGVNISNYSINSIRKNIAYVSQDTFLFNDTIEENIRLGTNNLKIKDILDYSYSSCFVNNLNAKEKTILGERGTRLSGGEKQRITIARALNKDAPILILDEASSALDNYAEEKVQTAINNLMKNKTTIVIAHRLTTIINADKIFVFSKGKIVDAGTHNKLIKTSNIYKNLYQKEN